MSLSTDDVASLQAALEQGMRGSAWRKILHTLAVTGVADNQQLIRTSGLHRDNLRRTLDKMTAAASGYPPLFAAYSTKLKRGGQTGPAPRVYRLGESGAALCKADGLVDARPCQLEEARAILHALGILDLHLAALAAGLAVSTDRNLFYDEETFLRPDNVVTLPGGSLAIFESEQSARSDFLNRMLRSLSHKIAFFKSKASEAFSPIVRVLIDLPRGRLWQQTLRTWRNALEISRENHGRELPFRLLAIPLGDFLANPDWSGAPETGRWVDLTEPQNALVVQGAQPLTDVAETLPEFSNHEQRMILAALYQDLKENGLQGRQSQPDVEFLYLVRLIYLASHDPFAPALLRSGTPHQSLYLLDQYLQMNPALRQLIEYTMQMDARRIHWNQSTALHRMQVVVDAFLEYHGWQSSGPLRAYAFTPDYLFRGPRRFSVDVEITNPEILMPEEIAVVPGDLEIEMLENALAWVLSALFAHTHHLGFKKPPFW